MISVRALLAPLAALLLAGCCKSEIDKCVDAQLAAFDSAPQERRVDRTREQREAEYRVFCMRAAGGVR